MQVQLHQAQRQAVRVGIVLVVLRLRCARSSLAQGVNGRPSFKVDPMLKN